ncbi:MAG: hypothetical protein GKS07_06005 [Nitrosopumilus sp.]|nr:MAG: hypothetical protein GKS07_06005 [Nitrosopumilus sp.]
MEKTSGRRCCEKKQLVKVVVTAKCKAKIKIVVRNTGTVNLKHTPANPDQFTCTKYKEVIYWATRVGPPVPNGAQPIVNFGADAKCDDCGECTGTANDGGKVKFDHR